MASLSLAFDILARDKASKTFDKVGDAAEKSGRKGENFGKAVGAGILVGGAAALKFGKDSVAAFKESEDASLRLDAALAKFPATSDKSRASFDALNAALAKKTKFDDDATSSGQAVLAQFGLTGTQIQKLTPLLQDFAAKTGKDIPTAAGVLGKALLGKGKALSEVGIKFKDAGSTGANFEQIVGGLRTQVGGFAAQEGQTAAGQTAILGNQFGELQETVGSKLVPVLTKMAGVLLSVVGFFQENSAILGPVAIAVGVLATAVIALNAGATAYAATQAALNLIMAANPFVLVALAIAALVAAFIIAYKNSETFRDIVTAVFDAVKNAAQAVADFFTETIPAAFTAVKNKVGEIVTAMGDSLSSAWASIKSGVTTAFNAVKTFFTEVWDGIKSIFSTALDAVKSAVTTVFDAIKAYIETTLGTIKTVAQTGLDAVKAVFTTVFDVIKTVLETVFEAYVTLIRTALNAIKTVISTVLNLYLEGFRTVFNAIKTVVSTAFDAIQAVVSAGGQAVRGAVTAGLSTLAALFRTPFNAAKDAADTALDGLIGIVKGIPARIKAGLGNLSNLLVDAGGDLLRGLGSGIQGAVGDVVEKAKGAARAIVDGVKGALGISSPSKVMAKQVGLPMMQGVALGISRNLGLATMAMDGLAGSANVTAAALQSGGSAPVGGVARGGTTVNVYPQTANLDPQDLANILRRTELLYG